MGAGHVGILAQDISADVSADILAQVTAEGQQVFCCEEVRHSFLRWLNLKK